MFRDIINTLWYLKYIVSNNRLRTDYASYMKENKTFYDITNKTGLSIATVSRYFNKPDVVADKSKNKIESAIKELGYNHNKFAHSLATGNSKLIGVIVPNLEFDFYTQLLSEIMSKAHKLGLQTMVFNSLDNPELEQEHIKELQSYNAMGIINYSHNLSNKVIEELNLNMVVIERHFGNFKSVSSNNAEGGRLAFNELQKKNCDIFININDLENTSSPVFDRTKYFLEQCKKNNVTYEFIESYFDIKNYLSITSKMSDIIKYLVSKYPNKKIGVFLSSDYFASIFKNQAVNMQIDIPNTLSIIGFDNSPISYRTSRPLTTIAQDIPNIAETSLNLLFEKEVQHVLVDVDILVRTTT